MTKKLRCNQRFLKSEALQLSKSRLCNCQSPDTIAFGDGRNDIEMIEETGLGIAMGNAVPELKSVAKYVTANIEEEGITAACKHFNYISD